MVRGRWLSPSLKILRTSSVEYWMNSKISYKLLWQLTFLIPMLLCLKCQWATVVYLLRVKSQPLLLMRLMKGNLILISIIFCFSYTELYMFVLALKESLEWWGKFGLTLWDNCVSEGLVQRWDEIFHRLWIRELESKCIALLLHHFNTLKLGKTILWILVRDLKG